MNKDVYYFKQLLQGEVSLSENDILVIRKKINNFRKHLIQNLPLTSSPQNLH
jgi:hypothetical protein